MQHDTVSEDLYDEVLLRLHDTGPEFDGWLSNHGPMAADALIRLACADRVHGWLDDYVGRLDELPRPRWPITVDRWRDPLGDPSRLGDWLAFFIGQLDDRPWQQVLTEWWPRLLPGAVAAATHPLIRTGHAVRALQERISGPRITELGHALGYWAARWAPLPHTRPAGQLAPEQVFEQLPAVPARGGARTRLAFLSVGSRWSTTASLLTTPSSALQVPAALDRLVDAAVSRYAVWAAAEPTMLVHMATAPRAARLAIEALPTEVWLLTYRHAWATTAAIASMYRPRLNAPLPGLTTPVALDAAEAAAAAAATGDEHAIKFTEVALESHSRGGTQALAAAWAASTLAD